MSRLLVLAIVALSLTLSAASPAGTSLGRFALNMTDKQLALLDGVTKRGDTYEQAGRTVNSFGAYETLVLDKHEFPAEISIETLNGKVSSIHAEIEFSKKYAYPTYIAAALAAREELLRNYQDWTVDHDCLDLSRPESKAEQYAGTLMLLTDEAKNRCYLFCHAEEGFGSVAIELMSAEGYAYYDQITDDF